MDLDQPPPPSPGWYRAAVAVAVAGLVAAATWWPYATTRVFDAVEAFERTGPYGGPVELTTTGTHTFWIEGPCLSCHDNLPGEYREVATASVLAPDGRELALRPAPARVFNTARREGRSLWLFDVRTPGVHRLSLALDTGGEDWENTAPANVAVGAGNGLPVGIVRPMAALGAGGIVGGGVLAVVTAVRRRRYYERSAELS
ncbi:MAG TPA: hypothetical protein VM933_11400 [Acidimicrobiales bacterium]|nr:hypothetical protein [Acidimicrobiales bacterium]